MPKKKTKYHCRECNNSFGEYKFYKVKNSPMFEDGVLPICKDCIKKQVDENDPKSVLRFLQMIDKPFKKKHWEAAVKSKNNTIGSYLKMINFKDFEGLTFLDSDNWDDVKAPVEEKKAQEEAEEFGIDLQEMKQKWGSGYAPDEYQRLEKQYEDMTSRYDITDPHHKHMVKQICKMQIQLDKLLEQGKYDDYTKLSKTLNDMMKSAGLRPADQKGLNEQKGIRSFGEIFAEVEKRGFIPPWEEYKITESVDIVDKMMLAYINHVREFRNMDVLDETPEDIKKVIEEGVKRGELIDDTGNEEEQL